MPEIVANLLRTLRLGLRTYVRILVYLAILTIAIPTIFGLLSFVALRADWHETFRIFFFGARISGTILLCALLLALLPLTVSYDQLVQLVPDQVKQSVASWLRIIGGVIAASVVTNLLFFVLPLEESPGLILPLMLGAVLFGALGGFHVNKGVLRALTGLAGIWIAITMVFHKQVSALGERFKAPHRIAITAEDISHTRVQFFRSDGRPNVWYARRANGSIECFDSEGADGLMGDDLVPVTREVVQEILVQIGIASPRPVSVSIAHLLDGSVRLFGPKQEPLVWVFQTDPVSWEFFDRPGYHPVRGVPLTPIDPVIAAEVLAAAGSTGASVSVGPRSLVATETTAAPAELTMMEPARITFTLDDIKNLRVRFFDRSGNAIVWYAAMVDGGYELFDASGAHPVTGRELKPITQEIADSLVGFLERAEAAGQSARARVEGNSRENEHDRLVARYLVTGAATNDPGTVDIVTYIVKEGGGEGSRNSELEGAVVRSLAKSGDVVSREGLLRTAFLDDGLFRDLYDGRHNAQVDSLRVQDVLDYLVLGRLTSLVEPSKDIPGAWTSTSSLRLVLISTPSTELRRVIEISETAAGPSSAGAEDAAVHLLARLMERQEWGALK